MKEKKEKTGTGKWSLLGVPHQKWFCNDIGDLYPDTMICEMCEKQTIRFVHYMSHEDYPDVLLCGCVCAGNMEGDYTGAKRRETEFKNTIKRRENELKREAKKREIFPYAGWCYSKRGNEYRDYEGYIITIFPKDVYWSASIKNKYSGETRFSKKPYNTEYEAKLAAFDALNKSSR